MDDCQYDATIGCGIFCLFFSLNNTAQWITHKHTHRQQHTAQSSFELDFQWALHQLGVNLFARVIIKSALNIHKKNSGQTTKFQTHKTNKIQL